MPAASYQFLVSLFPFLSCTTWRRIALACEGHLDLPFWFAVDGDMLPSVKRCGSRSNPAKQASRDPIEAYTTNRHTDSLSRNAPLY